MKKITKASIKKVIKELGFELENFKINKNEIETVRYNNIELGNEEVEKIVKYFSDKGYKYYGRKWGWGAWNYVFDEKPYDYSEELVMLNID